MRIALTLLAVVVVVTTACSDDTGRSDPRLVPLTAEDAGATIEVAVGDHLQVELESNASTGFSWVNETEETATLVAVCEPEIVEESDVVGAPGMMQCMFEARAAGQASIELAYRRAWEDEAEPERVFQVTVVVKDQ